MDLITPPISPTVPSEVLLQIFSYLDIDSVRSCMTVCKTFNQTIEERLWKILFFRDFSHFLYQMPLHEQDLSPPKEESDIQMVRKHHVDSSCTMEEEQQPMQESMTDIQEQILREASIQLRNWKGLYILCYLKINLTGYWVGDYGRHGKELVKIEQKGYEVIASKVTGDENVPAGQITWRMTLDKNLTRGKGFMQVAEIGYNNPAWVTAYINVLDKNSIQVTWFVFDHFGNWYSLTFGTVRAGANDFNSEVMERKVEMLVFNEANQS